MTSVPVRQPPQNQGDAASARTDSAESGARSGSIAVQAVLTANQADTNDAAQYISVPPAESGGGSDGHDVASPVQGPPLPQPLLLLSLLTSWFFDKAMLWQIINFNKTEILLDGSKTRGNLLLANWLVAKLLLACTGIFGSNVPGECMPPHWQLTTSVTEAKRERIQIVFLTHIARAVWF